MIERMIRIEVPKGRLQEIMDEIDAAMKTIDRCYVELMHLGVVTVTENTAKSD